MPRTLVLSVCLLSAAACSSPQGTYVTPAELAAAENRSRMVAAERAAAAEGVEVAVLEDEAAGLSPQQASAARVAATTEEYQQHKRGFDGRRRDLTRRLEDLAHRRAVEAEAYRRQEIEHIVAAADEQLAVQRAELELAVAGQDLDRFRGAVRDRRLREEALELQSAADQLLEVREELAQLELMYDGDDLGDATAEIVLSRTRRRLARAEERHGLAAEESAELRQVTLPREEQALELEVIAAMVALENAQRRANVGELERAAALLEREQQLIELGREGADIAREEQELEQDLRNWERTLSAAPGARAATPAA